MIEHRKSARHDVNISATLTVQGTAHETSILNLSVGGALVVFEERLSPNERVELAFRVPTLENEIKVGGVIRWAGGESLGVQFDGLRAKEVWALNKYFESLPG